MKKSLSRMNTNELRDLAVELGADRKKLYGTSKQSLILTIDRLRKEAASKENYIIVDENDNVMFGGQHYTEVGADKVWNMYNGIYISMSNVSEGWSLSRLNHESKPEIRCEVIEEIEEE